MSTDSMISIIDFGGQFSHLIARRLRDIGVLAELTSPEDFSLESENPLAGIILSGGPRSVNELDSPKIPPSLHAILKERSIPILGICYGHQLLGEFFGGTLGHSDNREYGSTSVEVHFDSPLLKAGNFISWMSHGDHVSTLPKEFELVASSESCPIVAMQSKDQKIYGVQFHPEVTHTQGGFELLQQFAVIECGINPKSWSMKNYSTILIEQMKHEIGDNQVLLGVSGGVDSLVAALVLYQAIKSNLHLVFIDHGLLRKNEAENVILYFEHDLHIEHFHFVNARKVFLEKLKNIQDPEEKRKIIGFTFIEVFEKKAEELTKQYGAFKFLGQGTIYSDRVESGAAGSGSAKIKSHHNLTLPDTMSMHIIEPLKELYKDEVRELGSILGAPKKWINRFPFPGPGLAVRIIGSVSEEEVSILQEADKIFLDEIYAQGIDSMIWQAFAVLLPGKAVGVMGDSRAYGRIIALRAVQSKDGMTADFVNIPWEILGRISTKIINQIPEVTRVVYDVSTKPPATIEFE
ncbi:MAG: glutamine-hydrolyzing GMP synthase [Candidatus Heimdallarchaeota archaeon]|nr:glutamine-hydrolyzing GMP synthase [Candidatus Heimdallarchaeota archaeon]